MVAYGDNLNISTTLSPLKEDELVSMPNLPGLLANGKHSHFGDASSMFGDFVFFLFSEMDDQCSDTPMVFIGDLSQCSWIDETILLGTHFNYRRHKLFYLGGGNFYLRGLICE